MGLSSSRNTTNTEQTGTQTATTTPNNPQWVADWLQNWGGAIDDMMGADPNSFVAGAAPLQQAAWNSVGNLNGWQPQAQLASNMAHQVGNMGANMPGSAAQYSPSTMQASTYNPAQLGGAAQATAGQANASQGASFMDSYRNPYQQQVIDASMSDFDADAGRREAAMRAQGARAGAFGGSRFGLAEGQFQADAARARAGLGANLRSQGFNTAAGLGMADADRFGQVSGLNAGLATQVSGQNADAVNRFSLAQAGMDNEAGQFNAGSLNNAAGINMAAQNQAGQFNAGNQNQFALFGADQQDEAANRGLAAAGQLAGISDMYAGNTIADLGLMSQFGGDQRAIEQAYLMSPLAQMQLGGQLLGGTPLGLLSGQTINGTESSSGTSTTRQGMNLFQTLLGLGQNAANAYATGAG